MKNLKIFGVVAGIIIFLFLLFFGIYFANSVLSGDTILRNNFSKMDSQEILEYMQAYMDDSVEIVSVTPQHLSDNDGNDFYSKSIEHGIVITHNGITSGAKAKRTTLWLLRYYDETHKKYFEVYFIGANGAGYISQRMMGSQVKLHVNNSQFSDPNYGTLKNPVPVLLVEGIDSKIYRNDGEEGFKQELQNRYYDGVLVYLSCIIPKDELINLK